MVEGRSNVQYMMRIGLFGEYRGHQFLVVTGVVSVTFGKICGENNIKVLLRKNEFGVYSSDLRWHLYKTGNFKQVLVHYVFMNLAASWCQELECK